MSQPDMSPQPGVTPSPGMTPPDVHHFSFTASDETLADLRHRIEAMNWPEKETVADPSQGVQLATMRALASYWETEYDWRKVENRLNALPQFITDIDGLDIHFLHVRSEHEDALPLIVTHGWPGSIIEQMKIIDPLTNPTAHGGSASDAFHLVIPSMPGYGFSAKPTTNGWGPERIARAWITLMKRLGYTKFVAQGGDWGAVITELMGVQAPPELLGIHVNMPATVPPDVARALLNGGSAPAGLSDREKAAYASLNELYTRGSGYADMMVTRPQTLAYGLADSPAALAAFFYDKFADWTYSGGEPEKSLTMDQMLDDITLYWLTNTGGSSARLYWENNANNFNAVDISLPTAITVFPGEIYRAPRTWADRAYHNLIYYNEVDRGGQFAAWEQPQLFSEELRAGFRSLR